VRAHAIGNRLPSAIWHLASGIWYLVLSVIWHGCGWLRYAAPGPVHWPHWPLAKNPKAAKSQKAKAKANTNKAGAGAHDEAAIECMV
jgi:hypothetical protein